MQRYPQIIRGSQWYVRWPLEYDEGWPVDADTWTWQLLLDPELAGGTVELSVTAYSAALSNSNTLLTLRFLASSSDTEALSKGQYWVDLQSNDGADDEIYNDARGKTYVRDRVGES